MWIWYRSIVFFCNFKKINLEKYSPVLIIVYDRYQHFQKCIESLSLCPEAKYTHLYISSDFYRNDNEKNSVFKVRKIIENIKGFKKVTPFCFKRNMGVENAVSYSREKIFQQYNSLITAEDDNVFSPLFLTYMNKMINYYKNDKKVFAISGFSPNVFTSNYLKDKNGLFKSRNCAVWGFSISKENYMKFNKFIYEKNLLSVLNKDLADKSFVKKLNEISLGYYPHFLHCIKEQQQPAFDHLISYYCLKYNLVNIHSLKTYVKNFGLDGTGQRNKKNLKISKVFEQVKYAKNLPELKSLEDIRSREDLVGSYANNLIIYWIKLISIKLGFFNILKKFSSLI